MKRFIDSTLLGDVSQIAHESVRGNNYADWGILDQLNRLGDEAFKRSHFADSVSADPEDPQTQHMRQSTMLKQRFTNITTLIEGLDDDKLNNLSRALALDTVVNNAVSSAERAYRTPTPEKQITDFLNDYFSKAPDKKKAVADLKDVLDDMVLSFVHTMHPTVYHSAETRRFEKSLSGLLEKTGYVKETRAGDPLRLTQGQDEIKALFDAFVQDLASGKTTITPDPRRPVTVTLETQTEKENYKIIRAELKSVIAAWNSSLTNVAALDDADRQALHIDETREKRLFQMRTWGQAADADGREKATSTLLYDSIQNNMSKEKSGSYEGEIMDMRQNAKIHMDFMGALIQVKHRNADPRSNSGSAESFRRYGEDVPNEVTGKTFDKFIEDFMAEREQTRRMFETPGDATKTYLVYSDPDINWRGHKNSIFQQLQRNDDEKKGDVFDDRAEFISELIKADYRLVPEQLRTDVTELTAALYEKKKEFFALERTHPQHADCKTVADYIRKQGYDPETITYDEMINVSIPGTGGNMVSLRGAWDAYAKTQAGAEILHNGLQYNRAFGPGSPEPTDMQVLMQNYLQGTRKLEKGNVLTPLSLEDRATLMDTIKRMVVANNAIDQANTAGSEVPVATRYQIANFSEPADFLIALKLFQEAGLVEVQKGTGEVTKTKMGIMPLLETGEDLENAEVIFGQLLNDKSSGDIVRSYYKARGRQVQEEAHRKSGEQKEWNGRGYAEIMLGFSDGSASTGNYGSQWKIYQAARKLTEMFDKEGIDVRFLQGRGRGVDRGGTIDPTLQMDLMPPEFTKSAIYDVTIQSDLPMDLAASEVYGKDYFTRAFIGTMRAAVKSRTMPEAEHERLKGLEKGIEWIAEEARAIYNKEVRNNPEALPFLNPKAVPNNPYTTSRKAARKENPKFDEIRAIPKEYYANGADLPMHNVGLGMAISKFVNLWDKSGNWVGDENTKEEIVILNKEGQKVTGTEAFKALYEHPFHKAMMQTVNASMQHFDPVIAEAHGEITNSKSFVANAIKHLSWLGEAINRHTDEKLVYHPSTASALDHIAHGIIVSGIKQGKPIKPNFNLDDERTWGETLYNALFVTSQEVGHRQLPQAREQQMALSA